MENILKPPVVLDFHNAGTSGIEYANAPLTDGMILDNATAFQKWTGRAIIPELRSKTLVDAGQCWVSAATRSLPRLTDMREFASFKLSNDTLVFMRMPNGDYLVVSMADNMIQGFGFDMRGMLQSEIKAPTGKKMWAVYEEALSQARPVYVRYASELSNRSIYWEDLILPLAGDRSEKPTFALNIMAPLDSKAGLLEILFNRSAVGNIAAVAARGEKRKLEDGQILAINMRAKQILGMPDGEQTLATVRDIAPFLRDVAGWKKVGRSVANGLTHLHYLNPQGTAHTITVEEVGQFVLFSIHVLDR